MASLKDLIDAALTKAKLDAHPVGSYFWSSDSTSPATLFGGTWEQVKDRFLYAVGDGSAAGDTGGEATHTLTEAELPALSGEAGRYVRWNTSPIASGILRQSYAGGTKFPSAIEENCVDGVVKIAFGGNQPHNNLPPFVRAFCWRRTA